MIYLTILKTFLLFILCVGIPLCASAQGHKDSTAVFLGFTGSYGTILPHSSRVRDFSDVTPWGGAAEVSRLRITASAWRTCQCYSRNGIQMGYFNFVRPELGMAMSAIAFAEPELMTHRNNVLSLRAGAGFVYVTKIHHERSNPDNVFFSIPLSGILLAQLTYRMELSAHWNAKTSIAYYHISNGGLRQPNLGMNFPMVNVGAEYVLRRLDRPLRSRIPLEDKALRFYAGIFVNHREVDRNKEQRRISYGLQAGFIKPVASMHGVGLALEGIYDRSLRERKRVEERVTDHRILALLARHHLLFGRFDFSQGLGVYLHKGYPARHALFQRYALEYRILSSLTIGVSLKAHTYVAEQMDIRATVKF